MWQSYIDILVFTNKRNKLFCQKQPCLPIFLTFALGSLLFACVKSIIFAG